MVGDVSHHASSARVGWLEGLTLVAVEHGNCASPGTAVGSLVNDRPDAGG